MEENFYHINNDLLVRYLLKETDATENRMVIEWLDADESNRKFFEHFQIIWEESRKLGMRKPVSETEAWHRFQKRIHPDLPARVVKMPRLRQWTFLRVAAVLILVIAGGWITYYLSDNIHPKTLAIRSQRSSLTDTLSDGSVVILNKNSSISYPEKFNGSTRPLTMEGEAFFNISPNKKKPFVIHVNDITVKVIGTSFNIRNTADSTEVIVETGVVEVTRNGKTVMLTPNEKVTVNRQDELLRKLPVTDSLYTYYRSKIFPCHATPLWKLVEVLNQAYDSKITIDKRTSKSLPITVTLQNLPLDSALLIVSETLDLTIERSGDSIILK